MSMCPHVHRNTEVANEFGILAEDLSLTSYIPLPLPSPLNSSGLTVKIYAFEVVGNQSRINISFPFPVFHSNTKQIFNDAFISKPFVSPFLSIIEGASS